MDVSDAATPGTAVEAGRARFRQLPERIRFEDTVEMEDVSSHGGPEAYKRGQPYIFFACLAQDQGL